MEELSEVIDGWYWPLRLRHIRALAEVAAGAGDERELGEIELEFRRLGYGRLADLTRRARR